MTEAIRPKKQNSLFSKVFILIWGSFFIGIPIFLLGGIVYCTWLDIQPFFWNATSCDILRVEGQNVQYRYSISDQTYTSDRRSVDAPMNRVKSGGGFDSVSNLRSGNRVECFVNSSNPNLAVLFRRFPWYVFFSLIPIIFIVIGIAVVRSVFSGSSRGADGPISGLKPTYLNLRNRAKGSSLQPMSITPGDFVFRSGKSRSGKVIALLLVSLFWNGIVSVFVFQLYKSFSIFLCLFLTPFILIGLLLVFALITAFLALFNPALEMRLRVPLKVGERTTLNWRIEGKVERIDELLINLEGQEEVTYRRGTDTHTDTRIFEVVEIAKLSKSQLRMATGSSVIDIPASAIPSFSASNNRIKWYIRTRGNIPRWPDIDDEFTVEMVG